MNFHPRLIINEHFDALISRIDIKTEELLKELQATITQKSKELNDLREKQIKQIQEAKELNLKSFEQFKQEEYERKWSTLIHATPLNHEQKIDQIKEEIISVDCVLLEQGQVLNGLNLWITKWFHNSKNLEVLK